MLKLLKFEWIQSWRRYSLFFSVYLSMWVISGFAFRFFLLEDRISILSLKNSQESFIIDIIVLLVLAISLLSCLIIFGCFFFVFDNYKKTMFSHAGYLTLTLPVTSHQLVLSKLIMSVVWIVLSVLAIVLGSLIFAIFTLTAFEINSIEFWKNISIETMDLFRFSLIHFLVFILQYAAIILCLFTCVTFTHTGWVRHHRTLIAFLAFLAIGLLLAPMESSVQNLSQSIFYYLIQIGIFYGATIRMLEKKIEVQ